MPLSYKTAVELFQGYPKPRHRGLHACAPTGSTGRAPRFLQGRPGQRPLHRQGRKGRILSLSDKGTETIVHILKEGAIFGELPLSEEQRAFSAVAGTDALVTVLSKGSLVELLDAIPTISRNFIRLLSKRLANVEREFGEFGHTWSFHRLARVLLRLCEEHGKETPKGTVIPLRLTHEDLANLIGTTRETVTTQMIRFRRGDS